MFFVFFASTAFAEPKNGFGVNAGLASHSMKATFTQGTPGTASYSSSGLSLGIDYQIALSDHFSLNPFLMTSGESASGDVVSGTSAGHGILGLQLRYWLDDLFMGAHLARYTEVLSNSNYGNTSAAGPGIGLVLGWEKHDGGLFVMGQLDSAKVAYADADVKLTGFRLSIGYRWK
jgi:hypothetical protein